MPSRENSPLVVDHLLDVRQLSFRPRSKPPALSGVCAQCLRRGSRHLIGQRPAGVISGSQQFQPAARGRRQAVPGHANSVALPRDCGSAPAAKRFPAFAGRAARARLLGGIGQRQATSGSLSSSSRAASAAAAISSSPRPASWMPVINHQPPLFAAPQSPATDLWRSCRHQCAQRRPLLGEPRRLANKCCYRQGVRDDRIPSQRQRVALLADAVHALKQGRIARCHSPSSASSAGKLFIQ